jgi:hypothetical protein
MGRAEHAFARESLVQHAVHSGETKIEESLGSWTLPIVRNSEQLEYTINRYNKTFFHNYVSKCFITTYDRLCGLVVRVLGYRLGGPGSIPGTTRFSGGEKKEK